MQQASKVSPMLNITWSAPGHTYTGLSQIARVYCMCTEPCTCSTSSSPSILVSDRLISMWKSERKEAQYLTRHLVLYNVHGGVYLSEHVLIKDYVCGHSRHTYMLPKRGPLYQVVYLPVKCTHLFSNYAD